MPIHGCDLASYQWDVEPAKMITTDFMIIKATQGTWYTTKWLSWPCPMASRRLNACSIKIKVEQNLQNNDET